MRSALVMCALGLVAGCSSGAPESTSEANPNAEPTAVARSGLDNGPPDPPDPAETICLNNCELGYAICRYGGTYEQTCAAQYESCVLACARIAPTPTLQEAY